MAATSAGTSAPTNGSSPHASAPSVSSPSPGSAGGGLSEGNGGRPQGDDILATEDENGEPLFGVEAIERVTGKNLGSKKSPKTGKGEAARPGHVLRSEAAEAVPTSSDQADPFASLESAFQRELQPPQDPDSDLTIQDGTQPSEREQNRVQVLANRTRQAEERAQALESSLNEARQQFQESQNQFGEYLANVMQQNAALNAKIEMLMQGQRREALDPAQQIEQELIGKASTQAERRLMGHIQKLEQRLEQSDRRFTDAQRAAEVNANRQRYSSEGRDAALNVVLKGLADADAQQLLPTIAEDVLATAWGQRTNAAEAAKLVRERYIRFGLAFARAEAKLRQQTKERGDAAPKPPPAARGGGRGEAEPSVQQLAANGYRGLSAYMDWELAGKPPLARS